MSNAKQPSKRKRRKGAAPVLGAAGLSLALASGASAAAANLPADTPTRSGALSHEVTLGEEEVADVSLTTFYVFGKEHAQAPRQARTTRPGVRLAMAGAGGCAGCGGCGGCWTGTYYNSSVFGGPVLQPHDPPVHKRKHRKNP
jgi:hypothetical protein